jgi:hypothetical protein
LTPLVADFRDRFLPGCEGRAPEASQLALPFLQLRWRQVSPGTEVRSVIDEISAVTDGGSFSDLGIMTGSKRMTLDIVDELEQRGIRALHTVGSDYRDERRRKHYFFRGDPRVKVTTIHNFKGWELSRCVVVLDDRNPEVAYTALSRLAVSDEGSALSVVCSVPRFAAFGATWPEFDDTADRAGPGA